MNKSEQLRELFKAWRDVEPSPYFEERVWRRIDVGKPAAYPGFFTWLLETLSTEPTWIPSFSAICGVAVAAFFIFQSPPAVRDAGYYKLDTLSGSYVRLVTGGQP